MMMNVGKEEFLGMKLQDSVTRKFLLGKNTKNELMVTL